MSKDQTSKEEIAYQTTCSNISYHFTAVAPEILSFAFKKEKDYYLSFIKSMGINAIAKLDAEIGFYDNLLKDSKKR